MQKPTRSLPHRTPQRVPPSIRARLVMLTLAFLLPATAIMSAVIYAQWRSAQIQLERYVMGTARSMARSVESELLALQAALVLLADSPSLRQNNLPAFREQALRAKETLGLSNITLNDSNGQQLLNLRTPHGTALPLHGSAAHVQQVATDGVARVTDLFVGNVSGRHVVNILVPVQVDGRIVGVLGGAVEPDRIAALLNRYPLQPTWIAAVYDRTVRIVARTHDPVRFVGKIGAPRAQQAVPLSTEGAFDGLTLDQTRVRSIFSKAPTIGWAVIIGIPQADLNAALLKSIAGVAAAAFLLALLTLAAAIHIGSRIRKSVHDLVRSTARLGSRVPDQGGGTRPYFREALEVGDAIGSASELLEDSAALIRESERRLRTILESADEAVMVTDAHNKVILLNANASRMFGVPPDEAMGSPLERFIDLAITCEGCSGPSLDLAGNASVLFNGRRRSSEEFPIEGSVSATYVGEEFLTTFILRDVTERVRAEQALLRSNSDLQQFAYIAAHDLQNPLRSIAGFVELLAKDYGSQLDDRGRHILERTAKASQTLEALTTDLLSYARLNAAPPAREQVSITVLVREVVESLETRVQETSAHVVVGELPVVAGNPTQLRQLLANLIGNSLKYRGKERPLIKVGAELVAGVWIFSVSDNGIGIPDEHRERVFEIFTRLHGASTYEGTGIGLALCRRIVENHHGRIWVSPAKDGGCTICFTLPGDLPP